MSLRVEKATPSVLQETSSPSLSKRSCSASDNQLTAIFPKTEKMDSRGQTSNKYFVLLLKMKN